MSGCVCVCICVLRERDKVCVCLERERERERERVCVCVLREGGYVNIPTLTDRSRSGGMIPNVDGKTKVQE